MTFVINWGTENEIEPKLLYFVVANCLLTFRLLQVVGVFSMVSAVPHFSPVYPRLRQRNNSYSLLPFVPFG